MKGAAVALGLATTTDVMATTTAGVATSTTGAANTIGNLAATTTEGLLLVNSLTTGSTIGHQARHLPIVPRSRKMTRGSEVVVMTGWAMTMITRISTDRRKRHRNHHQVVAQE
jgi:hypothetical protein